MAIGRGYRRLACTPCFRSVPPNRPARPRWPGLPSSRRRLVPAAGGVAIGLAAGSTILAVVLGVGAWLSGAGVALSRSPGAGGRRGGAIDPWAVPEPWRQYVRQARRAGQRFDQAIDQWPAGPLQDRLLTLQPLVAQAAEEVWSVAQRGAALVRGAGRRGHAGRSTGSSAPSSSRSRPSGCG